MSFVGSNILAGASGQGGAVFKIDRSLRFNSGDSANLSKTFSSAGNRKTFTFSCWVKRSKLGAENNVFHAQNGSWFRFEGSDEIYIFHDSSNSVYTTAKFRDPSAWYHLVLAVDTTQSTASNRIKLYVNGTQQTLSGSQPSQNADLTWNNSVTHYIGRQHSNTANMFSGYLADVHFIDGQALAPTDFGEFDDNNVWQPKKFEGTYNTASSFASYPGVTISPTAVGGGNVSHVNGGGSYFYSQSSSGAGSIKVEFSSPITGVTSIKYNGGGYSVSSVYNIKINGTDVFTNLSTNSGWSQASHTISSTDISSFEIYTANDGWSLYNLLFNDVSPSGTASLASTAGVNGFHLDFSDNSSNAALGTNSSGVGTTLPGVDFDGTGDHLESADHADYSFGTNDFTIEFYVYPREFVNYDALVMKYAGAPSNSSWWTSTNSSGHILFYLYYGSSEVGITTSGTGMNLNAWNHVACVRDGSTARVYINGVQVGTGNIGTNSLNDSATALRIGEDSQGSYDLNGVMSNVRIINGTCLYTNGTTFTVPSTPLTNVTNTKLLCCQSSSSATAATVSPNTLTTSGDPFATSKNDTDWTVNNLQAAGSTFDQSQTWSSLGTGTAYTSAYDWNQAFDGIITTTTDVTFGASGATMTWTPSSAITVNTSVTLYVYNATNGSSYGTRVNGSYITGTNNYNVPVTLTAATLGGQLTSIQLTNSGLVGPYLGGVEVDGVLLVDSGVVDPAAKDIDSLIDTPTNYEAGSGNNGGNYPTWNPLTGTNQTFSNGNLEITTATNYLIDSATMYTPPGARKWYWEFVQTARTGTDYTMVGMLPSDSSYVQGTSEIPQNCGGIGLYIGVNGVAYVASGAATAGTTSATFDVGDILGWAFDAENGTVQCYKNGVAQGTQFTNVRTDIGWTFCVTDYDHNTVSTYAINFGQRPFAYTPPTGYVSLCTTNLPDPTIANGSTAFDAVTYTGDGNSPRDITGYSFSPDLVWYKQRDSARDHQLYDIVRGAGTDKSLASNNIYAENANDDELYGYLSAFNSDGFEVTTGSTNDNYNNNNGSTYVAWAWDGGAVGTNEVGSYWNTPYQTKYIGFKFPTSSGGRAVFGLISGTGYADIYTSSDNSSWTRVQQNVTLSTTDTTYDSSSQYLIVVNTSNAVWGATHYAMATNGTDAHYSGATYPGSGASFSWSGPGYTDWDFRSSGTVIKPGGLNSSLYDQSQDWSGGSVTGATNSGGGWDKAFDGAFGTGAFTYATNTSTLTMPSNTTWSNKFEVYALKYGGTLYVNGTDVGASMSGFNTTAQWHDITSIVGSSGTLSSIGVSDVGTNYVKLFAVRLDGKLLVDSGESVTNVPSIASTVRANTSAGFSISTYTGDSSGSSGNIGHGLNATPDFIIFKSRDVADNWAIYHSSVGLQYGEFTDTGFTTSNVQNRWSSLPTSSVIHLGSDTNINTKNHLIYAWSAVEGYSSFGKYTGNGSTDGVFIYTNFTPRWVLFKRYDSSSDWTIYDTSRDPHNVAGNNLKPNTAGGESAQGAVVDILSNGFKFRRNSLENGGNDQYIYAAFAEHPFKTARAR